MGWASEEFETIELGDARLNRRAVTLAEAFADSPTASIPRSFGDWAELKAAYRFFDNDRVGLWDVLAPHVHATERRMEKHPIVLCLQDTTTLDFNGQDIEGLGPLNYEPQRGLLVHPTYVVTPGREPLGTIDAWNWARGFKNALGERPADVNESLRWVEGYERVAETAAEMPGTRCVYVGDRESDLAPLMRRAAELDHPADWLVRARHDRVLEDGGKLFESVGAEAPIGQVRFRYRPGRGVKARDVVQQVHVQRVKIGKRSPIEATCLIAREIEVPAGVKALEWRLLSNRSVADEAAAAELIDWYRARWEIETFFDVLKNGCQVESLQLKSVARLEVALGLFMIVAWRINRMMRLGRGCPTMPASVVFEPEEITAAYALNKKAVPSEEEGAPTMAEVVRLVAMVGGFIGRKGDGEPGARTIWRGIERVMSFADGLRYARAHPETG